MNIAITKAIRKNNYEAAQVLLAATVNFLLENEIPETVIRSFVLKKGYRSRSKTRLREFGTVVKAYEDMGMIMSTWFTNPKFLDTLGQPIPLSSGRGPKSFDALVRRSRVNISPSAAIVLLRQSSSVRIDSGGELIPIRRAFLLPEYEIPRATLIVGRFLETLHKNSLTRSAVGTLLIERCCYVSGINAKHIAPAMRDIRASGSAYMDLVDGQLEGIRSRQIKRSAKGEVGVITFAWTKIRKARKRTAKVK